jgi:hypothetical protein
MNQPLRPAQHTAPRGAAFVGGRWLDTCIAPGLVVDSNRPAIDTAIAIARGLLRQFGAAH